MQRVMLVVKHVDVIYGLMLLVAFQDLTKPFFMGLHSQLHLHVNGFAILHVSFNFLLVEKLVWKFLADVILVPSPLLFRITPLFVLNSIPKHLACVAFGGDDSCGHIVKITNIVVDHWWQITFPPDS